MKNIIGTFLVGFSLGGLLVFGYFYMFEDNDIKTNGTSIMSVNNKESYHFQDIEKFEKAESIIDAFEKIFGNDRLLNKENVIENMGQDGMVLHSPGIGLSINMQPGYDTRMEMIDFLHYIQYSGLTENAWEKPYSIDMYVYQPVKPGMNKPDPHQKWSISTESVKMMDFSDKKTMVKEIHQYGKFEDVDSGIK